MDVLGLAVTFAMVVFWRFLSDVCTATWKRWSAKGRQRPGFDAYWMGVAVAASTRASCPRASVGAVAVDADNCIIVTGYNGAPTGEPHCVDVGCDLRDRHGRMSCYRTEHAERNMVRFAKEHDRALLGSTVYCTLQPCRKCAEALRDAGVFRVVYMGDYPDAATLKLFKDADMVVEQLILK